MKLSLDVSYDVGQKIDARRQELGLSKTELAERAGLSKTDITRYIGGRIAEPALVSITRLSTALGWTPNDMASLYGLFDLPLRDGRLEQLARTLDQLSPADKVEVMKRLDDVLEEAKTRVQKQS